MAVRNIIPPVGIIKYFYSVVAILFVIFCCLSCENIAGSQNNLLEKINEEVAYANAPWVPLWIETGNLGTASLIGSQAQTVKKGYSFCIVTGAGSLSVSSTTTSDLTLGGMAGRMESDVVIDNCRSTLNVTLLHNGIGASYAGGIVGTISGGPNPAAGTPILRDIIATGNVTCKKTTTGGDIYAGGIAGSSGSYNDGSGVGSIGASGSIGGKLLNLSYAGSLGAARESSGNGDDYSCTYGGGIIGYCQTPRLENCVFEREAKITVGYDTAEDRSFNKYIGGIAGRLKEGIPGYNVPNGERSLFDCIARGNIDVASANGSVYTGGITGNLWGSSATDRISLEVCTYEQGTVSLQSAGNTYLGGINGSVHDWGAFANCHSRASLIEIAIENEIPTGLLNFGGFGGYLFTSEVKYCDNASPIVMKEGAVTSGTVNMGGFAGAITYYSGFGAKLENCWSTSDVRSFGTGLLHTGGLVGFSDGDPENIDRNEITQCRADGDVYAEKSGGTNSQRFYTGGLVGYAYYTNIGESRAIGSVTARSGVASIDAGGLVGYATGGSIENCYALGNVIADRHTSGSGLVNAGGIVGTATAFNEMQHSFAKGNVTVQNAGSGAIRAGGIAGYRSTSNVTIQNNAALNSSVTAKGGSGRAAARIYAYPTATEAGLSGNYANESMRLEISNTYNIYSFPYWDGVSAYTAPATANYYYTLNPPNPGAANPNGEGTASSAFGNQVFWSAIMGFGTEWNLGAATGRGYPKLAWEE